MSGWMMKRRHHTPSTRRPMARFRAISESLETRDLLAAADVMISEIMYHPNDRQAGGEFIELYNRGTETIDLEGWRLTEAVDFTFGRGVTLSAGQYFVVVGETAGFSSYQLDASHSAGPFRRTLDNGGEPIRLQAASGELVDEVIYDDASPWPSASDGMGVSLELLSPSSDNGVASSWGYWSTPFTGARECAGSRTDRTNRNQ